MTTHISYKGYRIRRANGYYAIAWKGGPALDTAQYKSQSGDELFHLTERPLGEWLKKRKGGGE